ncbi:hypothetical protein DVK44_35815 [Streptomyces paludis]|uniref:Carrier domain-containing protein n=1 Tax=Streptomyces paludis TaxID=2282738 RepID=A0A345I2F6_9ACTN|nr:hypothetical protein DVK44_35815 [Streptomyces paludis]
MAANLTTTHQHRITRSGITPLTTTHAHQLLHTTHHHQTPHTIAAHLNTALLSTTEPLWRSTAPSAARGTARAGLPQATALGELARLRAGERLDALADLVHGEATAVLGHTDPGTLDRDRPFRDLGFDSLTAVELRNRLNTLTGLRLAPGTVFDHPTVPALAAHLDTVLFPAAPAPAETGDALDRLDALLAALADHGEESVREGARQRVRDFLRRDTDAYDEGPRGDTDDDDYLSEVMNSASFSDLKNLMDEQFGYGDTTGPDSTGPRTGSTRHESMDDV